MGIETKIKSLWVPQTKILEFSFSTGGHFEKWLKRAVTPRFFFLATSRISFLGVHWKKLYHSWRIMGGGEGAWGPPLGYGLKDTIMVKWHYLNLSNHKITICLVSQNGSGSCVTESCNLHKIIPHFNALQTQGNSLKSPLTLINCKLMDGFPNLLYGLVLRYLSIMDDEFNVLILTTGKIPTN